MIEESPKYIYESPDGGKTIYRRHFMDYETPRELVKDIGGFLIAENIDTRISEGIKHTGIWTEF